MLNRRALSLITLLVVLAAFVFGLLHLFNLRFAAGDVYPPYSSLRGDPVGCKVYFEGLKPTGNDRVRRHLQSIQKLPEGRDATLFVFGQPWSEMSAEPEEYRALESFLQSGGRLVVTLYPELNKPRDFASGQTTNRATFKNPFHRDQDFQHPPVSLREKWGFGYEYVPTARDGRSFAPVPARRIQPGPFPENLTWHSALVFTNLDSSWRVLYARGTDPVMIERSHGHGSIVLATDSFFVSNEAMRQERAADLLAWLPGGQREILFDETHLGVQENPGVATLALRYKLHGGIAALIALAGLFIWKNAASFTPRANDSVTATPVVGRDSSAGFENLLRRSIAPGDLLQTTLDEWHKAAKLDGRNTAARREKIRAIVEAYNSAEKPDVVATYREISAVLNRKK